MGAGQELRGQQPVPAVVVALPSCHYVAASIHQPLYANTADAPVEFVVSLEKDLENVQELCKPSESVLLEEMAEKERRAAGSYSR